MSWCLLEELGFGHSAYNLSKASTCSGVYLTYLPESMSLLDDESPSTERGIITSNNNANQENDEARGNGVSEKW